MSLLGTKSKSSFLYITAWMSESGERIQTGSSTVAKWLSVALALSLLLASRQKFQHALLVSPRAYDCFKAYKYKYSKAKKFPQTWDVFKCVNCPLQCGPLNFCYRVTPTQLFEKRSLDHGIFFYKALCWLCYKWETFFCL